jgi:hypothetical protein
MWLYAYLFSLIALFAPPNHLKLRDEKIHLRAAEALQFSKKNGMDTGVCFMVDMGIHSGKNRFFIWDFKAKKIIHSGLCCHGMGLGSTEVKPIFSNKEGSYCTSLGKYATGKKAYSQWGIHIHYKLKGLEASNSNAFKRIVVLHSYDPIEEKEIYPEHLPMGWSLGCPVVDNKMMTTIDKILSKKKKPVLLWIYAD